MNFIQTNAFLVLGSALVTSGLWLVLTCIFLFVNKAQGKYYDYYLFFFFF